MNTQATLPPRQWVSLEELAESDAVREWVVREIPSQAHRWHDAASRREFLKLMAASLALAGVQGCSTRQPEEKILPYVRSPETIVPGKPLYYATATVRGGRALGVLVESHMGRPIKIEGNPDHPASLGATDHFAQAEVLTLYDPDRSQAVLRQGTIATWDALTVELQGLIESQQAKQGAGIRILTETVTSPSLAARIRRLLEAFPQARWHPWEPVNRDNARAGAELAFGRHVEPLLHFDRAAVVLSLDCDFLMGEVEAVRYAHDWAERRKSAALTLRVREASPAEREDDPINRLYVAEPSPTNTGARADHRLAVSAADIPRLAGRLAQLLGVQLEGHVETSLSDEQERWLAAAAADLQQHRGASLIVAGYAQPPAVHALVHALNDALGNRGSTLEYIDPVEAEPVDQLQSLGELVQAMDAGQVDLLLILGGNPAFTAPADFDFTTRLAKVGLSVHLGLFEDETSAGCHWHVPLAHTLESWGDARAFDGSVTIMQPLIEPLSGGRTPHDLLSVLLGEPNVSTLDAVQEHWRQQLETDDFDSLWQETLHNGVLAESAFPPVGQAALLAETSRTELVPLTQTNGTSSVLPADNVELLRPDPTIWDGRYANNAWLQELPKPLTTLTWDNVLLISPALAERMSLKNEDVVVIAVGSASSRSQSSRDAPRDESPYRSPHAEREGYFELEVPVWILPGQAEQSAILHFGYGRTHSGRVGTGVGVDAYRLRTSDALWHVPNITLRKTGRRVALAATQQHHRMEGRQLVRHATREEFQQHPDFATHAEHVPDEALSLYPPRPEMQAADYAWGMAIDLNACTGCSACVVACQAENNIPVVGKQEVIRGREMHWLRIDRYFEGDDPDDPEHIHFQPVMCMHCETAPCEVVCPVAATVHSPEGLNEMVYNRCVGTRYCSHNCPYKVRRFNFLHYTKPVHDSPLLQLLQNPDVTVRDTGVMEKCSYCVQRINAGRIEAEKQDRRIRDGEIVTACQAVCPARAITFGDTRDPNASVTQLKGNPLNYGILVELNTRPRTTYLAKVTNPNAELEK